MLKGNSKMAGAVQPQTVMPKGEEENKSKDKNEDVSPIYFL